MPIKKFTVCYTIFTVVETRSEEMLIGLVANK